MTPLEPAARWTCRAHQKVFCAASSPFCCCWRSLLCSACWGFGCCVRAATWATSRITMSTPCGARWARAATAPMSISGASTRLSSPNSCCGHLSRPAACLRGTSRSLPSSSSSARCCCSLTRATWCSSIGWQANWPPTKVRHPPMRCTRLSSMRCSLPPSSPCWAGLSRCPSFSCCWGWTCC